jgi:hypothetical protein
MATYPEFLPDNVKIAAARLITTTMIVTQKRTGSKSLLFVESAIRKDIENTNQ